MCVCVCVCVDKACITDVFFFFLGINTTTTEEQPFPTLDSALELLEDPSYHPQLLSNREILNSLLEQTTDNNNLHTKIASSISNRLSNSKMESLFDAIKGNLASNGTDFSNLQSAASKIEVADTDMAHACILMTNNPQAESSGIGTALQTHVSKQPIDWSNVISLLETSVNGLEFNVESPEALSGLLKFISALAPEKKKDIFLILFSKKWKNIKTQIDLIRSAVTMPKEQFDINALGLTPVVDPELYASAPAHLSSIARSIAQHPFNYWEFAHMCIDALCRDNTGSAKTFFESSPQILPELVFLGGVTFPRPWPDILTKQMTIFFEKFLIERPPTSPFVFNYLARTDKVYLISTLLEFYESDPTLLGTILLTAFEANILEDLLYVKHYSFTLELATQSDKSNYYLFETYLQKSVSLHGTDFIFHLLDFLEIKATAEYTQSEMGKPPLGLNLRSIAASLRLITAVEMPLDRLEQVKAIQIQCLQLYPRLINFGRGHDVAILAHGDTNNFSEEVETEMKTYYQKMYAQQIEIRDIITMLQRLKESDNPHEQDVFACMVHSLFDEYRFFPEYPLNALATTAVLFGSLVYFQLIEDMPLSIALRYILDSLKNPTDSNMFKFGLQALYEFRHRLPEFPKYCALLLETPGLMSQPQFYQQIKDIVSSGDPAAAASTVQPQQPQQETSSQFSSISAEVANLDESNQEEPSESVSDKVLFIVNNLAQSNVVAKTKELSSLLEKKYYRWFASYIVGQRSQQEPNYHSLYITMLQNLGSRSLEKHFVKVTYQHIIGLLNNPDTISSSEKRTQVKNLAQWLGALLLANDKPILHSNANFKGLLMEGYDLNKLPVIIPFVCKTLERASMSTVFLPPNPWLMGIIHVLAELYYHAELKLNLKFEIEVLCNQLKLDVTKLTVSTLIRERPSQEELDRQNVGLAMEMQKLQLGQQQTQQPQQTQPQQVLQQQQQQQQQAPQTQAAFGTSTNATLQPYETDQYSALAEQFALSGNTAFVTHPNFKKLFQMAIDKALREVIQPVVERSISIASITTKELISKDFALEQDENKMRNAARNVIRVLVGNISLATAKEPLRESLTSHLKALVVAHGYGEHTMLLDQVTVASNDNIDTICSVVERAAVEKSIPEIEESLMPSYTLRQRHRESNANQPFIDPQLTSRYALQLPDPFRLHAGGLLPQQMAIYENFGRYHPDAAEGEETQQDGTGASQATSAVPTGGSGGTPTSASEQPVSDNNTTPRDGSGEIASAEAQMPVDQIVVQLQNGIEALSKSSKESSETKLSELTGNHRVRLLLTNILNLAAQNSMAKDQISLKTSQVTVSALFTSTDTNLGREVFCYLLDKLCAMSPATAKEVMLWLIYSDDERKYNVPVMSTLINSRLVSASDIDVSLSKQVLAKSEPAINFASGLIKEAVLTGEPCALRSEFISCIEAMEILAKEDPPNIIAVELLHELSAKKPTKGPGSDGEPGTLKDQMSYAFIEWIRLTQHPLKSERSTHAFVHQLAENGIINDPENLSTFIRTALEISVTSHKKCMSSLETISANDLFVAVDGLAKLIATILKTTSAMDAGERLEYAQNILTVLSLVFASEHDKNLEHFTSRPFFRLFSTLLYEASISDDGSEFFQNLYILIAKMFKQLQPLAFPAFSFSWMTLISHRLFLPKLLNLPEKTGWSHISELLECLVSFQGHYAEGKQFPETVAVMYKGTLRIFLVILHDYPTFLIENHYTLCNSIPQSFVQLRNVVLSAFPENMELPDPFTQGLKVDRLPEIKQPPILAVNPDADLQKFGLKKLVDTYLKAPSQNLIKSIASGFLLKEPKMMSGIGYDTVNVNIPAFNALVLYVGIQATKEERIPETSVESKNEEGMSAYFNRESNHLAFLTQLMAELNAEGRYFLSEAMANQLRYPNQHTHFYSCVILSLFGNHGSNAFGDKKIAIQHLITRVLLERIICNRPHPWGLMITFTELLKNSNYKFWDLPFTKTTPEIERMFASLYDHISNSNRIEQDDNADNANSNNAATHAAVTA